MVNANDSLTVSGDADVETGGGGMLDLSNVDVDGDETVAADGADGVTADTAGGATDVSILGGTAAMHVVLPDGAFDQPVTFTITRGGDDPAEAGTGSGGRPRRWTPRRLRVRVRRPGAGRERPPVLHDRPVRARRGHARRAARRDRVRGARRSSPRRTPPARCTARSPAAPERRRPRPTAASRSRCWMPAATPRRRGASPAFARFDGNRRALLDLRRRAGQRERSGRRQAAPWIDPEAARPRRRSGRCCGSRSSPHGKAAKDRRAAEAARLPAAVPGARRGYREGRVVPAARRAASRC